MLETVREYAWERLEESGEEQDLRDRHAAYYAGALEAWAADLRGSRQLDALVEIEADLDNGRTAWEWAVERGHVDWLDRALDGLCLFYEWRGRYRQGEAACRRAADCLENALPVSHDAMGSAPKESADRLRVLAHVLAWQGRFSFVLGHAEEASWCFERSLTLLDGPELGSQEALAERAYALYRQSESLGFAGEIERASRLTERSLAVYRALGDDWGTVRVLWRQALVAWRFADYGYAEEALEEGLALSRALGDDRGIAMMLTGLAGCAASQGRLEQAERTAWEGLALSRQDVSQLDEEKRAWEGCSTLSRNCCAGPGFPACPIRRTSTITFAPPGRPTCW